MRKIHKITSLLSLGFARRAITLQNNVHRSFCDQSHPSSRRRPGPLVQYRHLVDQGKLKHDQYQENVAIDLENLLGRLEQYGKDMEEYHIKLAKWEEARENERRKLLMEEAKVKQQEGIWASIKKHRSRLVDRLVSRGKSFGIEPGVGRWVSYIIREKKLDSLLGRRPTAPPAPKGLYLYGSVGSGKTMLMDMFYGATEGIIKHRRRFHFHEAMLSVHEHMHKIWESQMEEKTQKSGISSWIMNLPFDSKVKEWMVAEEKYKEESQMKNILPEVADKFLIDHQVHKGGASILCFDEIQVLKQFRELVILFEKEVVDACLIFVFHQTVDVFAVVALSGILSRLLSTGTILVATSNRAPTDLNQDGMHWEIFLKLVSKLEEHCETMLIGSEIDYRRHIAKTSGEKVHYFWPLDSIAVKEFENAWKEVVIQSGGVITKETIPVMFGRTLEVPQNCNGIARFSFEYLCGRPLGAADYIAISKKYHTVFITDIPLMSMRIRDKARRFITLIDELYNHHCSLYCSAAASIDELFQGTEEGTLFDLESFQFETETEGGKLRRDVLAEGNVSSSGAPAGIISMLSGQEEMFAFGRAVSRLIEMQTHLYLEGVKCLHPHFDTKNSSNTLESWSSLTAISAK